MVSGNKKSNTFRKVFVKTPGGKTVVHHKRRKPGHAKCAVTGKQLKGVPRDIPANIRKLTRSQRKPSRPFGGNLSSEAMRMVMKDHSSSISVEDSGDATIVKVGRLCTKIAGRDAGQTCVIVEVIDNKFVTIDGGVRRRKCNLTHLVPLKQVVSVKSGASHDEVAKVFEGLNLPVWNKTSKEVAEKPKKFRKSAKTAEEKPAKKATKKVAKKAVKKAAKKVSKEEKTEDKE